MSAILKNSKTVAVVAFIGLTVCYGYLKILHVEQLTSMLQKAFGGQPLYSSVEMGLFLLVLLLLQYVNFSYFSFYIDHAEHLIVRYGSPQGWLKKALLKNSLSMTGLFVLGIFISWLLFEIAFFDGNWMNFFQMETWIVVIRIYLFCILITLIQLFSLLLFSISNTYIILNIFVFILAMMSRYEHWLHVLPRFGDTAILLLNSAVNIVAIAIVGLAIWQRSKRLNWKGVPYR